MHRQQTGPKINGICKRYEYVYTMNFSKCDILLFICDVWVCSVFVPYSFLYISTIIYNVHEQKNTHTPLNLLYTPHNIYSYCFFFCSFHLQRNAVDQSATDWKDSMLHIRSNAIGYFDLSRHRTTAKQKHLTPHTILSTFSCVVSLFLLCAQRQHTKSNLF